MFYVVMSVVATTYVPLYMVFCSYYDYIILHSLFASTFYKIQYCFRSWG